MPACGLASLMVGNSAPALAAAVDGGGDGPGGLVGAAGGVAERAEEPVADPPEAARPAAVAPGKGFRSVVMVPSKGVRSVVLASGVYKTAAEKPFKTVKIKTLALTAEMKPHSGIRSNRTSPRRSG